MSLVEAKGVKEVLGSFVVSKHCFVEVEVPRSLMI